MVPIPILSRVFLFQICRRVTTVQPRISGIPKGALEKEMSFRQYTTSIPIMEKGSTCPR
jgi:hypothetical protein